MADLKTDSVEFTTKKSLKSLTDGLRRAVSATRAKVDQLKDDPLSGNDDDIEPQVTVLLSGHNFMGGTRMWGVQVYLYDLGDRRVGELVAVGESLMAGIMSYYSGGYFQLSDGKRRRDKILAILTENDTTAQSGVHLDGEDGSAAASAAPEAGLAPAVSGMSQAPAISPDGVDPLSSKLYTSIETLRGGLTQKQHEINAKALLGVEYIKFAEKNPAFPACGELKMLYAMGTKEGSEERYIYQPYLDLYPDPSVAAPTAVRALVAWLKNDPVDVLARCLMANMALAMEDFETLNANLYWVLVGEKQGADVSNIDLDWAELALAGGFEDWYAEKFGVRDDFIPLKPVEHAPQAQTQAPDKAEKAAPSFSAAGSGAGKFMPLSENPQGRSIALISAGVSLVLTLILLLNKWVNFDALLAPALLLVLLLMNREADSVPMTIPLTLSVVFSVISSFRVMSIVGVIPMYIIFRLIDIAAAGVYWLLALKKKVTPRAAAVLLLLLFAIEILANLLSLTNPYGILDAVDAVSFIAYYVSYFAAVFFASKHLLEKAKK